MFDLVRNPEDRFSHNKAHLFCCLLAFKIIKRVNVKSVLLESFITT